jgi:hypothetical protein
MAELIDALTSWQTFLAVLVVFGFAPRLVLRLTLLAYPKTDPRRAELMAELCAIPRIERPLWVAEQIELALAEGLPRRLRALAKPTKNRQRDEATAGKPEATEAGTPAPAEKPTPEIIAIGEALASGDLVAADRLTTEILLAAVGRRSSGTHNW